MTALAAIQRDVRGLVLRGSCRLPSKIPRYIQRLVGKETGKLSPGARVPRFPAPLTPPLTLRRDGGMRIKTHPSLYDLTHILGGRSQLPSHCQAAFQLSGSLKAFPVLMANWVKRGNPEILGRKIALAHGAGSRSF